MIKLALDMREYFHVYIKHKEPINKTVTEKHIQGIALFFGTILGTTFHDLCSSCGCSIDSMCL